jgi:ABC-type branched-subunit amino acid transport system substrate-binding protein
MKAMLGAVPVLIALTGLLAGPAAAQPIKLGELNSYKTFPAFLDAYRKGMELAVDEVNRAGGLLGRKVELVVRDDNGTPGDGVRVAEELVSREKVDVLMGTFSSAVGLAVAGLRQAAQSAVPCIRTTDRQDRLGERQPLHVPPAPVDVYADGDAGPLRRQAGQASLGDRLPGL